MQKRVVYLEECSIDSDASVQKRLLVPERKNDEGSNSSWHRNSRSNYSIGNERRDVEGDFANELRDLGLEGKEEPVSR